MFSVQLYSIYTHCIVDSYVIVYAVPVYTHYIVDSIGICFSPVI